MWHISIAKCLLLAGTTPRHQPVHGHCTAMNTSPELHGTHFPAPILLCCHRLYIVTFSTHFRELNTVLYKMQILAIRSLPNDWNFKSSSSVSPFASAKSQAVFGFLSIYFVHSSSLFYGTILPQNPTTTALDPAGMGVIWEEAGAWGILSWSLAGTVPFSTKAF